MPRTPSNPRLAIVPVTLALMLASPAYAQGSQSRGGLMDTSQPRPDQSSSAQPQGSFADTPAFQTPDTPLPSNDAPLPTNQEQIGFAADNLVYDYDAEIVTANGSVQLLREGYKLRADKVTWYRNTGKVEAEGNVSVTDAEGNVAYGDKIDVTDTLKDGVVDNMLLVLAQGGRLAAAKGTSRDGIYYLDHAAYTGCAVEDSDGCPKEPTWQIKAVKVTYNPQRQRVSYKGARIEIFGLPFIPLPGLSHPVGNQGGSGLLVPDLEYSNKNGAELSLPYYFHLAPNHDLTITPHVYTNVAPMLEANYRRLTDKGAFTVTGYATYGTYISPGTLVRDKNVRGYIDGAGKLQFDPYWSVTGSLRATTDRSFMRRYDINFDDRLRSNINIERIGQDSYFSVAGWAVQTLRTGDRQGLVPLALPVIDYRRRFNKLLGGTLQIQANSLAIARTAGQETQRAFTSATWTRGFLTGLGQQISFTGFARGDVYHSDDNAATVTPAYRGLPGWRARAIAAAAIDMRWPLVGEAFGGTQLITPHIQLVAAPKISNLAVPNEDSRAVELEDSNLFALNRFPGYDRYEDSVRLTYGLEYRLDLPNFRVDAVIGQSYRLNNRFTLFPDGVGLAGRTSDVVGRTTVRFKDFISLTHRYRLDKDSLAIRRNELDATVGTKATYAMVSYLRLNRNIPNVAAGGVEDLRDREEVRLGGRVQVAKYWSLFGSTVIDLTDRAEDPLSVADGYEPVRHRLGVQYEDDCLQLALTWRRDYQTRGDDRRGNRFQLRLAFRNLGI